MLWLGCHGRLSDKHEIAHFSGSDAVMNRLLLFCQKWFVCRRKMSVAELWQFLFCSSDILLKIYRFTFLMPLTWSTNTRTCGLLSAVSINWKGTSDLQCDFTFWKAHRLTLSVLPKKFKNLWQNRGSFFPFFTPFDIIRDHLRNNFLIITKFRSFLTSSGSCDFIPEP